jgi:hypothetical protein
MTLFSGILARRQDVLHTPLPHNDLTELGAEAMAAGAARAVQMLAYLPPSPCHRAKGSPSPDDRRGATRTRTRRVQLNVDVSSAFKSRLRAYAKRHGASMGAVVETLCSAGMDRAAQ